AWAIWEYPPAACSSLNLVSTESVLPILTAPELQGERAEMLAERQSIIDLHWLGYHRLPEAILELEERGGIDVGYRELPMARIALSEEVEALYRQDLARIRGAGYAEGGWLEPDELKEMFPNISPHIKGGACFPGFKVQPYRYTLCLAQAAEKMGCTIRSGEVVGFGSKGSRVTSVVLASGTEVEADEVVLTMGPWTGQATTWLGNELPVEIHREQCIRVELARPFAPYGIWTMKGAVIPDFDDRVILHSFDAWPDLVTGFESSLTEESRHSAMRMATELFPGMEKAAVVEHRGDLECWAPLMRMQPVLGRHPEWDNVYLASRFGTFGMALSLAAGEITADLVAQGGRVPYRVKNLLRALSPAELEGGQS
ncbi:MAG: NAD(P)/FAD-dependent oxidoreductase, partial [Chloroflexota bacterium]